MSQKYPFDPKSSIGYLVNRAAKELRRMLGKGLADAGVDTGIEHFRVLMVLYNYEGINQQEIADLLGLDKTYLTRLLAIMEDAGTLVRVADKKDKRNKLLYLTTKGRDKREELLPLIAELVSNIEAKLDPEELRITKKVMSQVIDMGCPPDEICKE